MLLLNVLAVRSSALVDGYSGFIVGSCVGRGTATVFDILLPH